MPLLRIARASAHLLQEVQVLVNIGLALDSRFDEVNSWALLACELIVVDQTGSKLSEPVESIIDGLDKTGAHELDAPLLVSVLDCDMQSPHHHVELIKVSAFHDLVDGDQHHVVGIDETL